MPWPTVLDQPIAYTALTWGLVSSLGAGHRPRRTPTRRREGHVLHAVAGNLPDIIFGVLLLPIQAWIVQQLAMALGAARPRYLWALYVVLIQTAIGGIALFCVFVAAGFPYEFNPNFAVLAMVFLGGPLAAAGMAAVTRKWFSLTWGKALCLVVISGVAMLIMWGIWGGRGRLVGLF
jgi:hypothetical protein